MVFFGLKLDLVADNKPCLRLWGINRISLEDVRHRSHCHSWAQLGGRKSHATILMS